MLMCVKGCKHPREYNANNRPFPKKKMCVQFRRSTVSLRLSVESKSRSLRHNRTLLARHIILAIHVNGIMLLISFYKFACLLTILSLPSAYDFPSM